MKSFLKFVLALAFVAGLLIGGIVLGQNGARYATAQDNKVNVPVCQSEGSMMSVTTYQEIEVFSRPNSLMSLVNHVQPGNLVIGECADSVNPNQVVRYQWIETGSGYAAYAKQSELAQAMIAPPTLAPMSNNGSAAEATANAGAGPDIIVVGEGTLVSGAMHVPYASLVSLWQNGQANGTRMSALTLCLTDAGCDISGVGDTRYYTFRDGTKVPPETLTAWINTQAQYFPFATTIVNNFGMVVWTKAA